MRSILWLPRSIESRIGRHFTELLNRSNAKTADFAAPSGEASLIAADSVSWRVFKNPVALFIGGVTAVILELAESSIREGVWQHSNFKQDPMRRLQRTGLAAMVTVYGPRRSAEQMIANVVRMHGRVQGHGPSGLRYSANDPLLLAWVHATAAFGFSEAYHRFARPLSGEEFDAFYAEGAVAARLYGVSQPPYRKLDALALFQAMQPRLEASPIIDEFLEIMRAAPALPAPLRRIQPLLVRAAIDLLPGWVRAKLSLGNGHGLGALQRLAVRTLAAAADRVVFTQSPACQACVRMGLPAKYLY